MPIYNLYSGAVGITDEVQDFPSLPDAALNLGLYYLVQSASGLWFIANRKPRGIYRSDGTTWIWMGTELAQASGTDLTTGLNTEPKRWSPADVKELAKVCVMELSLGINYEDYLGELNSWDDLPVNAGVIAGQTYKTLNDASGHSAGYYIARADDPPKNIDAWGWEFRNLETPAEWLIGNSDYMSNTQQYTYAPSGVAAIAQAYCAEKNGGKTTKFYCKGANQADGSLPTVGDTRLLCTNREDVTKYVTSQAKVLAKGSWGVKTTNFSASNQSANLDIGNQMYVYIKNKSAWKWDVKIYNVTGSTRNVHVQGEYIMGGLYPLYYRTPRLSAGGSGKIISNWSNSGRASFKLISGPSGNALIPEHEWEVMLYQSGQSTLHCTYKMTY